MTALHAVPRTLADDLLVYTTGSRALHLFRRAMLATMRHLLDLGGRLAPTKSKLFTTVKDFGKWLAAEFWEPVQAQIKVVSHLRDLGSALTVAAARVTTYSYARLSTGIQTVAAIRKLPHPKEQKAKLVIRSAHKQSFYGCESSQVDSHAACELHFRSVAHHWIQQSATIQIFNLWLQRRTIAHRPVHRGVSSASYPIQTVFGQISSQKCIS